MGTDALYEKYNFFREPDWRWRRIQKLLSSHPIGRCSKRDDAWVRKSKAYLYRLSNMDFDERKAIWMEDPGVNLAYEYHLRCVKDPTRAMFVEARLLSRQTPAEIKEATGLPECAVRWYEALFFNVVDRLNQRDYITSSIILPALRRSWGLQQGIDYEGSLRDAPIVRGFLDGSIRMFSYFGGAHLAEFLLNLMQSGKPLPSLEDLPSWLDQTWMLAIRRRSTQAAQKFDVNRYNVMELFHIHTKIIEIQSSEEHQDQQKTSMERHIKGMVDDIPWLFGDAAEKALEGSDLGYYDTLPTELRDDELLKVAGGEKVEADDFLDKLPPPRKKNSSILDKNESLL